MLNIKTIGIAALLWDLFGGKVKSAASSLFGLKLLRPRLRDIDLGSRTIGLRVAVSNGTPATVVLNGYSGTIKRNNKVIGNTNVNGPLVVEAGSEKVFTAPVKINSLDVIRQIFQALTTGGALAPIQVNSILKTSIGNFPINTTTEFISTSFG